MNFNLNARIIESCHKNSSRASEWKKNIRIYLLAFIWIYREGIDSMP